MRFSDSKNLFSSPIKFTLVTTYFELRNQILQQYQLIQKEILVAFSDKNIETVDSLLSKIQQLKQQLDTLYKEMDQYKRTKSEKDDLSYEMASYLSLTKTRLVNERKTIEEIKTKITQTQQLLISNREKNLLNAAIGNTNVLIGLYESLHDSPKMIESKKVQSDLLAEIDAEKMRQEEELRILKQKAQEVEEIFIPDKDVLIEVEEFAIEDVVGDLDSDLNEMLHELETIMEQNRVEIKEDVQTQTVLKSKSGEIFELKKHSSITKNILNAPHSHPLPKSAPNLNTHIGNNAEHSENSDNSEISENSDKSEISEDFYVSDASSSNPVPPKELLINLNSGFENPFDDVIEEAILDDIIPYNFEITEYIVNEDVNWTEPERIQTKDGLKMHWKFQEIAPKQEIQIDYHLRHRVSRTAILPLANQIKIIKTHSNLNKLHREGLYDAHLTLTNLFDQSIKGIIVEDIIPEYYKFDVLKPEYPRKDPDLLNEGDSILDSSLKPNAGPQAELAIYSKNNEGGSQEGTLLKWSIQELPKDANMEHSYRLLDIIAYEDLKIKLAQLNQRASKLLDGFEFQASKEKYAEIMALLKEFE